MPPKPKQPKPLRCAYVEGRQQCRRPGDGNPPLCEAHRVVIEAEASRPQRPGEKLVGLLGRVLRGQKVNDDHLYAGIEDAVEMFANRPSFEEAKARARVEEFRRQQGWDPRQNHAPPRARKPAGPDPRVVLGFAVGQKVTAEDIKKRHRELARKHHPDRGGSVARMQEINAAVDQLLATL